VVGDSNTWQLTMLSCTRCRLLCWNSEVHYTDSDTGWLCKDVLPMGSMDASWM